MILNKSNYIKRLKDKRKIIFKGEFVKDVTTHQYFSTIVNKIGSLYDLQHHKKFSKILTVYDPSIDQNISRSYYLPRNKIDLKLQRKAFKLWAKETYGFMGRTPDYMNSFLASMVYSRKLFSKEKKGQLAKNLKEYYVYAAKNNLYLSHAFASVQFNKNVADKNSKEQNENPTLKIIEENKDGIIVSGCRTSVTLAPVSDELIVFGAGKNLKQGEEKYAVSFATPIDSRGLSFLCRQPIFHNDEHGNPFIDEIDCIAIFENVFIPWERVFIFNDINANNNFKNKALFINHLGRQVLTRLIENINLIIGLADNATKALGTNSFINVQEQLGKITLTRDILECCLLTSEKKARPDKNGFLIPDKKSIYTGLAHSQKEYGSLIQILKELSASSLINIPSLIDINDNIDHMLSTQSLMGVDRVRLFRLIHFISTHSFSGRLQLYERFWIGAPIRSLSKYWENTDKHNTIDAVTFISDVITKDNSRIQ